MSSAEIGQSALFEMARTRLSLQDRFLVPPFSVLDARAGYWQDRKTEWLNVGLQPELGREATPGSTPAARGQGGMTHQLLRSGDGRGDRLLSGATPREGYGGDYDTSQGQNAWGGSGTSIFDPVLCELVYRWWCPEGGVVFDPFAGGSVRGIVAAMLGREYHGTDLSQRQCEANREQAERIASEQPYPGAGPCWYECDARLAQAHLLPETADFVFSCPPYYDLEVYSDDPQDLSTATSYEAFRKGYEQCISVAVGVLKPDRFCCFVVGEVRDKKTGRYRGLVPDTIRAFEAAGASYYNEGILVTSVGSLPIRTSALFGPGRKLGKSHQNVLVFVKGDWRKACEANPMAAAEVAVEYGGATVTTEGAVPVLPALPDLDF